MAFNFNQYNSSISSSGLGLGNETIYSNLGLTRDGGVVVSQTTYARVEQVHNHNVFGYVQPHADVFPLTPVTVTTTTQVVKTARFLTPTSTLDRLFASNSNSIQAQFANQVINHFPSQNHPSYPSMNQQLALSNWSPSPNHGHALPFNPPSTAYSSISQRGRAASLQSLDTTPRPSQVSLTPSPSQVNNIIPVGNGNGNDENNIISLGNGDGDDEDGQIHSLPNYPKGKYGCPKCLKSFDSSQGFAAHVKSTHYKGESTEERKKRLVAKYKVKKTKENLRLVQSAFGLTAVPTHSFKAGRKDNNKKTLEEAEAEAVEVGGGSAAEEVDLHGHGNILVKQETK